MKFISGFSRFLSHLLNHPIKVIWLCLAFAFVNLVIDGSLLRLWSLQRERRDVVEKREKILQETAKLEMKIEKASDPDFIEKEARNRFDLVNEGDLVFVFSEVDE